MFLLCTVLCSILIYGDSTGFAEGHGNAVCQIKGYTANGTSYDGRRACGVRMFSNSVMLPVLCNHHARQFI